MLLLIIVAAGLTIVLILLIGWGAVVFKFVNTDSLCERGDGVQVSSGVVATVHADGLVKHREETTKSVHSNRI